MAWPPRRVLVQETEYAITDLGTLGGPTSTASDINDKGQVCGTSHLVNGASHAFLWQGRLMKKIAAEGFEGSIASRIDRFGRVVGDLKRGSMTLGFIFDPKYPSRLTAIQPLAPFRDVHARGINEKGQVVGWGRDEQGRVRALLWNTIGKPPIDLGTFGGPNSAAYGINSVGWITGYARLQTGKDHAFFRKTGELMDLGPPSDHRIASRFPFIYGYAINSSGQIAGYLASAPFTTGTTQAFTLDELENLDRTKIAPGQIGHLVVGGICVICKVDADVAPIKAGDLLTTSDTKGHAQKVVDSTKAVGAVLGKALGSLRKGKGTIPVLVALQ